MKIFLSSILIFFIFLLFLVGFLHPITSFTQDLGRHLLTGKIILQTHSVPKTNLFSYTYPDFPFINTHWFSEVIFYVTVQTIGTNGLLLISTLLTMLAFGLVFFYDFKKSHIFALATASLLYLPILFERTDIRPEIFSFLFVSLFITILYRYTKKFTRLIFLIPLLELLWVNMHIYFLIGEIIIAAFLLDDIVQLLHCFIVPSPSSSPKGRGKQCRNLTIKQFLPLTIVFLITIAVTLLNPNGIDGALYPFKVFTNYGYQIEENQNIFFLQSNFSVGTIPYFELAIVLLFISLFLTLRKTKPIDWLLAITFTIVGAAAIRNFPLFVFATLIPFTKSLSLLGNHLCKVTPSRRCNLFKSIGIGILLVLFCFEIHSTVSQKGFGFGTIPGAERAADFLLANHIRGPIFNNFDIGSYLEYRIFPEKVFVDGRPEAYPADFFTKIYLPMQQDSNMFTAIDHRYNFNTVFFAHTDQTPWTTTFLQAILQNKEWAPVYLDDTVVIFLKRSTVNRQLITKYGMDTNHLRISNLDNANFRSLLQLASFFNKVNLDEQGEPIYRKILDLKPDYCPALATLAQLLNKRNDPTAQIYAQRFQNQCN